jgi:hypothetical protein
VLRHVLIASILLSGVAYGVDEEAQVKLEAAERRAAQRATPKQSPTAMPAPTTKPSPSMGYRIKDGAPEAVANWFHSLETGRNRDVAELKR